MAGLPSSGDETLPSRTPPSQVKARGKRRGFASRAVLGLILLGGIAFGILATGYLLFATHVATTVVEPEVRADGIVVLTGGRERVAGALDLLEAGRAMRLLISGVHPDTTPSQIMRLTESDKGLFSCCIDLDRRAQDTFGNAAETRKWAEQHGFGSLIVVTSAYHMPRGILELRAAMPEMKFIPYPVIAADLNLRRWYLHPGTVRLLLREYVKYIVAWLRIGVDPTLQAPATVSASTTEPRP